MLAETYFLLITLLIIAVYLASYNTRNKQYQHQLLPGPFSFPIIGAALQITLQTIGMNNLELAKTLCKRYGSVMGFQAGFQYFVLIEDYNTAKQVLCSDDWNGRVPDHPLYYDLKFNKNLGVLTAHGEIWKQSRKFVTKSLRDFGFGHLKTLEVCLEEEALEFLKYFEKLRLRNPDDLCLSSLFNLPTLNILWRVMSGYRFACDNEDAGRLVQLLKDTTAGISVGTQPMYAFPFLRHIPGMTDHQKTLKNIQQLQDFFKVILEKRRQAGTYKHVKNDYLDEFLDKVDEGPNNTNRAIFNDENLIQCSADLFLAGSDTTPNNLEFIMLYMLKHPDVQKRVQQEIELVVGSKRLPNLDDRTNMPYTEAVIMEVMRNTSVLPLLPRTAIVDTKLNGCYVPRNSFAGINLLKIHKDEVIWGDPHIFRPERFLEENGNGIKKDHKLLAFGAGRRACIGYQMAKATLFIFFTSLLQKYSFEPSQAHPELSADSIICGATITAKPFYSSVLRRIPSSLTK